MKNLLTVYCNLAELSKQSDAVQIYKVLHAKGPHKGRICNEEAMNK